MRRLLRPCLRLLILLALVFLFEAWLWEHLAPVVGWVVARIPLRQIKAWIAAWIEHLPPRDPSRVRRPGDAPAPAEISWSLDARARLLAGRARRVGVTRPKLLQLSWLRRLYERVVAWLAWPHELIDPI